MALRFVDWPQELIDEYNYNMFGHTLVCNEKKEDTKMKKYTVVEPAKWYAVMENKDDDDWGTGSYNFHEAVSMARKYGPDAYIAVIEEGNDKVCVEEIHDLADLKEYRISFKDGKAVTLYAANEYALGSYTIIEWAAQEFGVDSDDVFTDGEDIWVEKDGEQTKLATVSSIEEVE